MKLNIKTSFAISIVILLTSAMAVNAIPTNHHRSVKQYQPVKYHHPTYKYHYNQYYILSDSNVMDFAWSADGSELAYVTCPDNQLWDCDLWIADKQFRNKQLIYTGLETGGILDWVDDWLLIRLRPDSIPSLTPEGLAVVGELWKIRDDGTELTRITSTYTNGIRTQYWNHAYDNIGTVGWGAFVPGTDGAMVYFSAHDGNGWWGAHLTTGDGSDSWLRILPYSYSFTIGMSPTGNKLLWGDSWYWNQPTTMYSSDVDGSNIDLIKSFPVKTSPLMLMDGETVVLSWPGGDIHATDLAGTNEWVVIDDEFNNYWSTYHSLQDTAFLMSSNRAEDGLTHIFKIFADGTNILQMTDGEYNDASPMISLDGHYLAYRRLAYDYDTSTGQPYAYELVVKDLVPLEVGNLEDEVKALYEDGVINRGQKRSLLVKLDHTLKQYMRHHEWTAINILRAFIRQVNSLVYWEILTEAQGEYLVDLAKMIKTMIKL